MKALLTLRHIKVENANAIAGMTWGFPAISSFLGFAHALSRTLQQDHGLTLGGCAVVCHQHSVSAHQPGGRGDYSFSLTRNPLNRDATSPSFVEEGRMHMEVSLVLECDFTSSRLDFGSGDRDEDIRLFQAYVQNKVLAQRLAGGTILGMHRWEPVLFTEVPEDSADIDRFRRKLLRRLLPGFVLVGRPDLLAAHFATLQQNQTNAQLIDAWLDFTALKYQAVANPKQEELAPAERKATWQRVPKPGNGWLVPLATGFKAISSLYENGAVANTRDNRTPFRLVESAHSIGQWISPHRITDLEHLFWRYQAQDDWYLCQNAYRPSEDNEFPEISETTH